MRQDPPFDMAYITATHLLERVQPKTLVVNDPAEVRNAPEKMFVNEFADLMPPTLITRELAEIKAFREQHGDVVMKPLYGHGGEAVFRVTREDINFGSFYDLFAKTFREPWVTQKYLAAVKDGDKRIILVDGEFAGAINRIPAADDLRSNMVRGGIAKATELTAREREICERLKPALKERKLLFAGIDVIGGLLTEINVTSPTGISAVKKFGGPDIAALIWDAIERKRQTARVSTRRNPARNVTAPFAGAAIFLLWLMTQNAHADGECRFAPQRPVTLKTMGPCEFDLGLMSFAGDAAQQAACLTTKVLKFGQLATRAELPANFAKRVGRSIELPKREAVAALLQDFGLEQEFGSKLSEPVANADDNDPLAPSVTYFVMHDTSSPNYARGEFPPDIDHDPSINDLRRYMCSNKIEVAHVFINRGGEVFFAHDFSVPWRATKFEMATNFASALKGLFVHVELIQPRRSEPRHGWRNDFQAPTPGFQRRAIRAAGARLHRRERPRRPLADPRLSRGDR